MLLIFNYTAFNFFFELLITMVVVSLLVLLFSMDTSLSFVCFQGFIPKKLQRMDISLVAACMAMFFLYAASLSTDHQLLCSAFLSLRMLLIFSLKVRLPRSTSPCVVGILGAP